MKVKHKVYLEDERGLDRNKEEVEPGVDEHILVAGGKPSGGGELVGVETDAGTREGKAQ